MKEQSIFWRFLVICIVGLFLVGGVFYNGTIGIFSGGIAFCQVEPEEEEEETLQTRPRPDTKPNQMQRMQRMQRGQGVSSEGRGVGSQKVQADGSGGGNVATDAGMKPASPHQQMRPAMPAQQMRPAAPMHR